MSLLVRIAAGVFLVEAAVCPMPAPETPRVAELKANVHEWDVPTKGAKPYATAVAPDGSVWFTEEMINKIGYVNPKTGECKEYPLTNDSNARPHGIAVDRNGSIWYAANSGGFIGKLEPSTGKVAVFKIPDPSGKDPDSLDFDLNGILWFTLPTANTVGRLDPASGAITTKPVPTENARPNSIVVLKRDLLVFCEAGASKIGFIAPSTFAIWEYPLPPGSRSRRLAIAADQNTLYFTDFVGGNLGKMDLSIGALMLLPSPGGPDSNPYGLTITADGMVWYMETGSQPNYMIRFDPRFSTFARAPIPFATGVVHDLTATPDGRVYLASSGVDKVGAVEVPK